MIYKIHVSKEGLLDEEYLVEGKDSLKEIKSFLINRGYSEFNHTITKIKPLTIDQFKNKINKH